MPTEGIFSVALAIPVPTAEGTGREYSISLSAAEAYRIQPRRAPAASPCARSYQTVGPAVPYRVSLPDALSRDR